MPDAAPPDLTTPLAPNLTLPAPIVAASGAFGWGEEISDLADCGSLGALITPTLTLLPRMGNPMPRAAETAAGLLHATGLPNPGLDRFLRETLPRLRALPCPVIASVAAESPGEWKRMARTLGAESGIAALELNLTPLPLLLAEAAGSSLPGEAELLRSIRKAVSAARAATPLPLLAKLPPVGAGIAAAAQVAADAGADVLCVGQAFPGVAMRLSSRKFRFPGVVGGVSGPAIKPMALYQVWQAATAVSLPILGGGGVMTTDDALEFLVAGASAVAVGTACLIHPAAIARIAADLAIYLALEGISSPRELVGLALRP